MKTKESTGDSYRRLMAAIISLALLDLKDRRKVTKATPRVKDEAMAWCNGPDCEAFCLVLEMDYTTIREQASELYRQFLATDPQLSCRGRPRKTRRSRQEAPKMSRA